MSEANAIEVHDLTVSYQHRPVLWDIDFVIPEGAICGIVGPNGAGKSTLMKAMMGLVSVSSGSVKIYDEAVGAKRAMVAYVPQRGEVDWDFPVSVLDVVLMGRYGRLAWFGRPNRDDVSVAHESLEKVGMLEFKNRQISKLSGGQQQRVFIARALAQQAKVYLMDEPFAGVDAATEAAIAKLFSELKSNGKTVVCVHHDLNTVPQYFDWLILLNLRLVACGAMNEVFTNENLNVTYGGRLGLLVQVTEALRKQEWTERK